MNAIILAGGYATRLWPITRHRPKMLLPVGDSTVIDRIVTGLEGDERVDEIYVSTNQQFAASFRDYIRERGSERLTLTVEESSAESQKLGVVGALAQLVEREGLEDDTVVIAGDNLISFDVGEFVDRFQARNAPTIAAYDVGSVDRATSYGVLELEDDRVVGFEEKPDEPESTLVSIACYGFPGSTLECLETYLEAGNNPDEPGWFVKWLQRRTDVFAFPFDEAWFDVGTPESYLDALAWYLDGGTYVAESATVQGSTLGENVQIMADAEVINTDLERSIVFPDATVRDSEIRSSIIDRDTALDELNLRDALIGAHTQILNGRA